MLGQRKEGYDAYVNFLFKRVDRKPVNPHAPFSVKRIQWQKGWADAFGRYAFYR